MGWFGHRVYSKSMAHQKESIVPASKLVNGADTNSIHTIPDTLLALKKDSSNSVAQFTEKNTTAPNIILASNTIDTLWSDDKETILKMLDGSLDIRRKFTATKSFEDFSVNGKWKGNSIKILDFTTSKYGKLYKAESKKSLEIGAVFAGRFAFTAVDCGMGCFASTIIDLKTGNVYDGPHASIGYKYKLNSRLLIVNPPDSTGYYFPCDYCEPELYVWTGKSFKKIE